MFFGKIDNLDIDRKVLPEALVKGLEYLKKTDFSTLEPGRYEIDGDHIFALVQDYQTYPKTERRLEAHTKFIDIQFIALGMECIGYAPKGSGMDIDEDLLEEKDLLFFKTVKNEMELVLDAGAYAIFYPGEIHRPCCICRESSSIKKVVVKVSVNVL